jgi:hypothetical protein
VNSGTILVVCSGTGISVFGLWMTRMEANNWLGEFHCFERRFGDGRMARREDWHCENGMTLADHHILHLQEPEGHRPLEVT